MDNDAKGKAKGKRKDNALGRGKEGGSSISWDCRMFTYKVSISQVDKDEFFDMLRSGGIVSKA